MNIRNRKTTLQSWYERVSTARPPLTEQQANILKSVESMARDAEASGWDKPAKLYVLNGGDENDPIFNLVGTLPTYPVSDLVAGFDGGFRIPDNAYGAAIMSEGYRHLTLDELFARQPQMEEQIQQRVDALHFRQEGDLRERLQDYYQSMILPHLPDPSNLAPFMRAEVRTIVTVLRDGTYIAYGHTRDTDQWYGDLRSRGDLVRDRFATALYMFVNGLRPDGEHLDPFTAVSDYQTVQALSELPVKKENP